MNLQKLILFIFLFPILFNTKTANAGNNNLNQMNFLVRYPTGFVGKVSSVPFIYAYGEISSDTPQKFKYFIHENNINGGELYLNSPGGNLLGGIALGEEIRAANLNTHIGADAGIKNDVPMASTGLCASACALAFLGGHFRYADTGSGYAVHRFFFPKSTSTEVDDSQVLSAIISNYVNKMGIDNRFMILLSSGSKENLVFPNGELMKSLNIVNNGEESASWTIEATSAGTYLKGVHNTVYGNNKIIFACETGKPVILQYIFDSRGRDEVINSEKTFNIQTSEKEIPVDQSRVIGPIIKNGHVIIMVPINLSELNYIMNSKNIGFTMQYTKESPTFDGIDAFDLSSGHDKLLGYIKSCNPSDLKPVTTH